MAFGMSYPGQKRVTADSQFATNPGRHRHKLKKYLIHVVPQGKSFGNA